MQVNLLQPNKARDSSFTQSPECRGKATARVSLLLEGARHLREAGTWIFVHKLLSSYIDFANRGTI